MNAKRWSIVFKSLSNVNRLKIIEILSRVNHLSVFDISKKLDISANATSKHLVMLKDLGVLDMKGKYNNVFYSLNSDIPSDFKQILKILK